MGNDGAILLSRGLRSAESKLLGELDLGYNEIKDDGACSLAQVGFEGGRGSLCAGGTAHSDTQWGRALRHRSA
jgi:hypothetical protein